MKVWMMHKHLLIPQRFLVALTVLVVGVAAFSSVVRAADNAGAQRFIDDMGREAVSFLADESLSQAQKEAKFRQMLRNKFDIDTIGRFVLGRNWKTATPAQRKEYLRLFENLIVEVYSARFKDYNGEDFKVASAQDTGKNDSVVSSYIVPASGSKVKVDWRVRNKNGQFKIIDVIIEGVSMSLTQRSDFSSVIQRGGGKVEALLVSLRSK